MQNIEAELVRSDDSVMISFLQGKSEPLVFHFEDNKMDDFCKWNGETSEEFYAIFDMFIELKPLFKSLRVEDDEGFWYEYAIRKQPCKIKLRPLTSDEMGFLERVKANDQNPPNEIEQLVIAKSRFVPFSLETMKNHIMIEDELKSKGVTAADEIAQLIRSHQAKIGPAKPFYHALLRIIVQDFIKIVKIDSAEDFCPQAIIKLTDELEFFGEESRKEDIEGFEFVFHWLLIEIWISYAFEYKKMGVVKDLPESTRGLHTSKEAALYGITSIFLNLHAGGASNSKEAEMKKLAKKYYRTGALGEVVIVDEPERELEFFFSMMEYLGLKHIGTQ